MADKLGCCHDTCDFPGVLFVSLASVLHDSVGALQSVRAADSGPPARTAAASPAQENFRYSYGVHLMSLNLFLTTCVCCTSLVTGVRCF